MGLDVPVLQARLASPNIAIRFCALKRRVKNSRPSILKSQASVEEPALAAESVALTAFYK